jgi:RNA polymerase sigma factor (sigma-70 family)
MSGSAASTLNTRIGQTSERCSRVTAEAPVQERFNDNRMYERFKLEARKAYQHAYGTVSDDQWDAAFNMSYWKLYQAETLHPGVIAHPASWIATIAKNEIVSEHRKTSRQRALAEYDCDEPSAQGQDASSAIERRHVLRDVCFILNLLPSRQKRVWSARFVWDYSPEEIMQRMGLSRKAYEKTLQQATSFLIAKLDQARQGICGTPEMESLVTGYAIWGDQHYSPERSALARAHLDDCAACRRTAWLIRSSRRTLQDQPAPNPPVMTHPSESPETAIVSARAGMPRPTRVRMTSRPRSTRRQRVLAG